MEFEPFLGMRIVQKVRKKRAQSNRKHLLITCWREIFERGGILPVQEVDCENERYLGKLA